MTFNVYAFQRLPRTTHRRRDEERDIKSAIFYFGPWLFDDRLLPFSLSSDMNFSFISSSSSSSRAVARQKKELKLNVFTAINWLLKQHHETRTKNQFYKSFTFNALWPFNLGSRNRRRLKNKTLKLFFSFNTLFFFSDSFVVFIYIVWS